MSILQKKIPRKNNLLLTPGPFSSIFLMHPLDVVVALMQNKKIEIENIDIYDTGLIKGNNFKNYEDALNRFMYVLTKIRRNI